MSEHIYYKLRFELLSPMCIGTAVSAETDRDVMLGADGKPFIPATTIAGKLAGLCPDQPTREKLFGSLESGDSPVMLYDALMEGKWDPREHLGERDLVALNRYRVADEHLKFDMQCVQPGCVFTGFLELKKENGGLADEGEALPSFAAFPEYRDRVVLLNGFSKAWAMTGDRLGFACGPGDVIDAMMKIHQYGIMSAPTLSQAAGVEAMDHGDKDVDRMRREYRKRRDYLVPALNALGLRTLMPKGAFYLFVDIRSTGLSDEEFALKLLKEFGVACVPGSAFGACGAGFVRMSYATSMDKIRLAVQRISKMLA